jgi:hypothetical protein
VGGGKVASRRGQGSLQRRAEKGTARRRGRGKPLPYKEGEAVQLAPPLCWDCVEGLVGAGVIPLAVAEVEQIEQIVERGPVDRNVRVAALGDRVGIVVAAAMSNRF